MVPDPLVPVPVVPVPVVPVPVPVVPVVPVSLPLGVVELPGVVVVVDEPLVDCAWLRPSASAVAKVAPATTVSFKRLCMVNISCT
jgi:hypothetical protein